MPCSPTLALRPRDVRALLDMDTCIAAVEEAFRQHGAGQAPRPGVLGVHVEDGGFHIKAGVLRWRGRSYFAAKVNGNFPANPERHGLPTIQGVLVLADAESGTPLALVESGELTARRTAAATAVAAKYLAREDARSVGLVGCGRQAAAQLRAVSRVRRLSTVTAFDVDAGRAAALARMMRPELGVEILVARDVARATQGRDIVITCTSSRRAFLAPEHVAPGAFVAAVGADHPEKQELEPALLAASAVVTDITEQAAAMGDLHHAIDAGVMTPAHVRAELGAIVAGRNAGRRSADERIVFDSTGMALQDVAAAAALYERARASGAGLTVALAEEAP